MRKQRKRMGVAALLVVAFASLAFAGGASAKLVPPFDRFQYCPWHTAGVERCLYSVTTGGEVVLGSKKVPIVNPVTLQGGYGAENETTGLANFVGATNGITLSKTQQPLPGGLAGLVNCKEIKDFFLRISCEVTFENGLTGVNTTLELARPASEIQIGELNLARKEKVAMKLPVKVHLENPFLGSNCYVGSSSSPIWWELTTGVTSPKEPNKPIEGNSGTFLFLEEGLILRLDQAKLVENNWSAPGANGCGGFLVELILNPILNAASGLPAAAGKNTAILVNNVDITSPEILEYIDKENP